jgi:hypothetical protein
MEKTYDQYVGTTTLQASEQGWQLK